MAEHRISREALLESGPVCVGGMVAFDAASRAQNNGSADLVYPNGWTCADRDRVRRRYPNFYALLLERKFIPATPVDEVDDA